MRYSEAFKSRMVACLAVPGGPSANALSQQTGISQTTLSRWLREAGRVATMTKQTRPKENEARAAQRPQDWSWEEKLRAVVEAASLSEAELGAFLRRKGLHEAQLEQWREGVRAGLGSAPVRPRGRRSAEARRIRELERELRRKDKALAEAAALLVLKKKAQAIWGDGDDDTMPRSGR
jgi:transposase